MDILTSKQKRTDYDAISRYAPFFFYYHTKDDKFVYGLTSHLLKNAEYVAHTVQPFDTLESLALKYYGRPDYYWIIADYNRIKDPFVELSGSISIIQIPNLGQVTFEVR
jgi:nucleoid-associated protein YgaU